MTTNSENQAPATATGPAAAPASQSSRGIVGTTVLAVVIVIALLDAVVETVWSGSPIRWWIAPPVVLFVALVLFLWRPGGALLRRTGPGSAAATLIGGLLLLLAATAWLPGGQTDGVRMLGQPTAVVLAGAMAAVVALAVYIVVRGAATLSPTPRLVVRLVFVLLGLYALAALGIAIKDHTSFAGVFQGGALWQRLPRWLQGSVIGALVLLPAAILAQLVRVGGHLRRGHPVRVLIHQTTALVMAFVMAIAGIEVQEGPKPQGVAASATFQPPPFDAKSPQARTQLERAQTALDAVEKEIPRDSFDPRALATMIGSDPATLFSWVRDNTYWVPYRGALRGASGVLMDRFGNSLDRALLLGALLEASGRTTRLAHATLPIAEARTLIGKVRPAPARSTQIAPPTPPAVVQADAERLAKTYGLDQARLQDGYTSMMLSGYAFYEQMSKRIHDQTRVLAEVVTNAGHADDQEAKSATAMADHWWVQRQEADQWVDMDPLLPDAPPSGARAAASETFTLSPLSGTEGLPSRFCQEVTVRVIIEQWKAGRVTEKVPLSHSFRAADTVGRPIVLQNVPLDQSASSPAGAVLDPVVELSAMLAKQTKWLPRLTIGEKTVGTKAFTDAGELFDAQEGGPRPGSPLGGGMLDAFGSLGGQSEPPAGGNGELSAEWIEYEVRIPGEAKTIIRRMMFDALGAARANRPIEAPDRAESARLGRAVSLVHATQILPVTCRLSPAFVTQEIVKEVTANRASLMAAVDRMAAQGAGAGPAKRPPSKPQFDRLYSLAVGRFSANPMAGDSYLDQPNILTQPTAFSLDAEGTLTAVIGFDIVANHVAVRAGANGSPFEARLAQGVADTNAEAMLAMGLSTANAGQLFAEVGGTSGPVVITPTDKKPLTALQWPVAVRTHLERDLEAGYVVVVPRSAARATSPRDCAWWRVNPKTGQSLGVGARGWGQGAAEKAIKLTLIALATFAVTGTGCYLYIRLAKRKSIADTASAEDIDKWNKQMDGDRNTCLCVGVLAGLAVIPLAAGSLGIALESAVARAVASKINWATYLTGVACPALQVTAD